MKYLFLNSYFDAVEKHIADEVDFDRMINAESAEKAFEVLQDTDYNRFALESDSLEEIFKKEKKAFKEDLKRLGAENLIDLFFLRADIVNLRIFLKRKFFDLKSGELLEWGKSSERLTEEFASEIEIAGEKKNPAKLDDYLTEVFLDKLEHYGAKDGRVEKFIENYKDALVRFSGRERDERIEKLEEEFIFENRKRNEGLAPVLAFFMKKWRAEKKIRAIIRGKNLDFSPKEIKNLTVDIQAI